MVGLKEGGREGGRRKILGMEIKPKAANRRIKAWINIAKTDSKQRVIKPPFKLLLEHDVLIYPKFHS